MTFQNLWKHRIAKALDGMGVPVVFQMFRNADESGTSGTGHVLDGVVFPSGKTVICWDPEASNASVDGEAVNSISVFDSFEAFHAIHIGQHPTNGTELKILH